ncbi:hypothetical protein [Oscillatoria salina]|uniref:hypothetical protein n=1 Tax=Oscillatoria salina TaxID=331517 RepID=UPI0013B80FD3|nr:hypothetical protein [Oscillatoria salina]MBZ8182634.1 hypothetical protein [Oscillatoria salina IIICB1]NET88350.1 hypothetical protein [Kamptonema sp. SIO1D9]
MDFQFLATFFPKSSLLGFNVEDESQTSTSKTWLIDKTKQLGNEIVALRCQGGSKMYLEQKKPEGGDRGILTAEGITYTDLAYPEYDNALAGIPLAICQQKLAFGFFSYCKYAELALRGLKAAGFPMKKVSLISRTENKQIHQVAKTSVLTGSHLNGITKVLIGLGMLRMPGIGTVIVAGNLSKELTKFNPIDAAARGLIGIFCDRGVSFEQAKKLNQVVGEGNYLVTVQGTENQIRYAEAILARYCLENWEVY